MSADFEVVVVDDDRGFVFSPASLDVAEGAAAAVSYSVRLSTEPSETVTVTVSGQSGTDLRLGGLDGDDALMFTTASWDTAQTVTVTAVDDDDGDDDEVALAHAAAGGNYEGVSADFEVVVVDDDRGFVFSPASLEVAEGAAAAVSYSVRLSTEPSETVTVTVSGQSGTDLRLGGLDGDDALMFTTASWDTAQTVTVTAVDDDDGDDDEVALAHAAAGGNYEGVSADFEVVVVDDDRGFVFSPASLEVAEGAAAAVSYSVRLSTEPSETVTVTVSGQSGTDLRLGGLDGDDALMFTTASWDTAQTVTVTAVDDDDGDDDEVALAHAAAGGNYEGVSADFEVVVVDDDRGFVFSPASLEVAEGAAAAVSYSVRLSTEPSETVTVTVSGQSGTDLRLGGLDGDDALMFTTASWDTAQTVTVTAVDDDDGDDDEVALAHAAAGGNYEGVSADFEVVVVDDDRGFVFSPASLEVAEGAAAAVSYSVRLSTEPSETVTVTVSGQSGTDLRLGGLDGDDALMFTTASWDTAQTVTVTAVDDDDGDDDEVALAHAAAGGNYEGVSADFEVVVVDDDRGFVFSPASLEVAEGAAAAVSYSVRLSTEPSETVTVTVSGQSGTDLRLGGLDGDDALMFTTASWDTAQTVTVTAVDDDDGDDDEVALAHAAAGGNYEGVSADFEVVVVDDDRGFVFSPASLEVAEGAAAAVSYSVRLSTEPSETVTVTVSGQSGTDLRLGGLDGDDALMFTTASWDTAQTVTVTAVDDDDGDDDEVALAHAAAGGNYEGVSADFEVVVVDDDRGFVFSPASLEVAEGAAAAVSYSVRLSTEPSETVTVTVSGQSGTDLRLGGLDGDDALMFTTANWDTAQTVTVTAVDDDDGDDDEVALAHAAAGGNYEGVSADFEVVVVDDDRGFVFSPASLEVAEGAAAAVSYSVRLSTEPSETVTVTVSGQSGTDLRLGGLDGDDALMFTTANWDTAQTVTVTAVDDDDGDDDEVALAHAAAGGNYEGVSADFEVVVVDDDRGFVFSPASLDVAEGAAAAVSYSVRLSTEPSETVTVTVSGQSGTDLRLGGLDGDDALMFTTASWDTAQTVTVTAVDDGDGDDDEVDLAHAAAGGNYEGVSADFEVVVVDDDRGFEDPCEHVWCATVVLEWAEDGRGGRVTIPLLSWARTGGITNERFTADGAEYAIDVVAAVRDIRPTKHNWSRFRFAISRRHAVSGASLGGPTERQVRSWTLYINDVIQLPLSSAAQTVGATDFVWYGEMFYDFAGGTVLQMRIEASDVDAASIVVSSTSYPVDEGRSYGPTYTVKLSHQPSQDVTVTVSGQNRTDVRLAGLSSANALTFTTDNWDAAQAVTVTARNDRDAVNDLVTLVHTGSGGAYTGASANLAVTVYDDDGVFMALGEPFLEVDEGDDAGQTYTVELSDEPSVNVTVTVSGHVGTDLTLMGLSSANALTFTTDNWATAQSVTVTAGQDSDVVDDVVVLTHTASHAEYAGVVADIAVFVSDNNADDVGEAPVENTAATGRPTISGTAAVGETLTADTTDIEDVDDLTDAILAYQWFRYDGATNTDIAGATSATYTVTVADTGYEIKVRVTFTDDGGHQESLTSYSVYVPSQQPLNGGFDQTTVPESHDGTTAFTFQIHFSESPSLGYENVRDSVLEVGNGRVTNARRVTQGSNLQWEITIEPAGNDDVTVVLPRTTDCGDDGAVCTQGNKMLSNRTSITVTGPAEIDQEEEREETPANTAATGKPAISGTAAVGMTLTASTSGIDDANGIGNASFSYQWLRTKDSTTIAISGATASTYVVVETDRGGTISVRVTFTDDEGHQETLTSDAVSTLEPLTGSIPTPHLPPNGHDGSSAFTFQIHFSESPLLGYENVRDGVVDVDNGRVTKARRVTQGSNLQWEITIEPSGSDGVVIVLPVTTGNCATDAAAVCMPDGRKLSNKSTATVSGPP